MDDRDLLGDRRRAGALLRRVGRRPAHHADAARRWPRWPRSTSRCPTPAAIRPTRCGCSPTWASPATIATTGARYFGFVNGATLPGRARRARGWRARGTRTPRCRSMSPVAARLHDVVRAWLVDLLGCPPAPGVAFVTGATVANAVVPRRGPRRAARPARLGRAGRRAVRRAADRRSSSASAPTPRCPSRSGSSGSAATRVHVVPADDQGRLRADLLPDVDGPGAGVRAGGRGQHRRVRPVRRRSPTGWPTRGGWLHVDGAFGLWALADPTPGPPRRAGSTGPTRGRPTATSGSTSPTTAASPSSATSATCGARSPRSPATCPPATSFEAMHHTPQSSQRARQIEVWAVLRTLGRRRRRRAGRSGRATRGRSIADALARRRAHRPERRRAQPGAGAAGRRADHRGARSPRSRPTAGCGAARPQWDGATAMRISVSSWKTDLADAAVAAAVILECAARIR